MVMMSPSLLSLPRSVKTCSQVELCGLGRSPPTPVLRVQAVLTFPPVLPSHRLRGEGEAEVGIGQSDACVGSEGE